MGVYPNIGPELSAWDYLTPPLLTLTGIIAGDGRLYRAAVFQDSDGGLFGECFDFPPIMQPTYVFGQGETLAECRDELQDGINAALGGAAEPPGYSPLILR